MACIIFFNPAVLATAFMGNPTGLDHQAVVLAACVAAAVGSFIMGAYARYPIARAPGVGNNYLFVTIVMSLTALGFANHWQTGLGIVFLSGVGFRNFARPPDPGSDRVSRRAASGILFKGRWKSTVPVHRTYLFPMWSLWSGFEAEKTSHERAMRLANANLRSTLPIS